MATKTTARAGRTAGMIAAGVAALLASAATAQAGGVFVKVGGDTGVRGHDGSVVVVADQRGHHADGRHAAVVQDVRFHRGSRFGHSRFSHSRFNHSRFGSSRFGHSRFAHRGFDRGFNRGFNRGFDRGFNRGFRDRGFDRRGFGRSFDRGFRGRSFDRFGHSRRVDRFRGRSGRVIIVR